MASSKLPLAKNALHYLRWKRIKDGISIEKVAEEDNVKVETIRQSFLLIEEQKNIYSMTTLETHQIESIMSLREEETASWREAFKARHRNFQETPLGTVVTEEIDHDVALSASGAITARIASLNPRKGFNLNVQANANAGASSSSSSDGKVSFESKLREILQRRQEQKEEPAVIDVVALPAEDDNEDLDES